MCPERWWIGRGRVNREGEFHSHPTGQNWHTVPCYCMYVVTLWRFRLSASTPYWLVGCFSPLTSWSWWTTNEPKVHWATTSWIHNSSDPNIFTHFFLSVRFISNEENINPTQLDVRAYCSLISKCFVFLFLNHLISAYGNQHLKKTSAAIVDVNIVRKRKTRKAHNKKKGKKKKTAAMWDADKCTTHCLDVL